MTGRSPRRWGVVVVMAVAVVLAGCGGSAPPRHREGREQVRPEQHPAGVGRLVSLLRALPGDADAPALDTRAALGYELAVGVVAGPPTIRVERLDGTEVLVAEGSEQDHVVTDETTVIEVQHLVIPLELDGGETIEVQVHLGSLPDTAEILANAPEAGARLAVLRANDAAIAESFMGNEIVFDDGGRSLVVGGSITDVTRDGDPFDTSVERISQRLTTRD